MTFTKEVPLKHLKKDADLVLENILRDPTKLIGPMLLQAMMSMLTFQLQNQVKISAVQRATLNQNSKFETRNSMLETQKLDDF